MRRSPPSVAVDQRVILVPELETTRLLLKERETGEDHRTGLARAAHQRVKEEGRWRTVRSSWEALTRRKPSEKTPVGLARVGTRSRWSHGRQRNPCRFRELRIAARWPSPTAVDSFSSEQEIM